MFLDVVAGAFEQRAVLHAAGTDGFAGAAAEAQIEVMHGRIAERQASILHGAHEVDAAAGRIVFVAGFEIGRAGRQAQPAVDARQRLGLVEKAIDGGGRIHVGRSGRMPFGSKVLLIR